MDAVRERFWERYSLGELNSREWEALCDGCGQCCLMRYVDRGKVTLPEFTDQFVGMPLDAAFQVGVDVDAVTRATVSSKAVTEAVAQAVEHVKAIVGQGR